MSRFNVLRRATRLPAILDTNLVLNAAAPVISGTVVEDETLTATNGTWTAAVAVSVYAYQWLANGVAIPGETTNEYVVTADDVADEVALQCQVTASNVTYTGFAVSNVLSA